MGLIQIDSVNVLVRSQELPLYARLGTHPRSLIPDATADGGTACTSSADCDGAVFVGECQLAACVGGRCTAVLSRSGRRQGCLRRREAVTRRDGGDLRVGP